MTTRQAVCVVCGAPEGPADLDENGRREYWLTRLIDQLFYIIHRDANAFWDTIARRHRQRIEAMPQADPSTRTCKRCGAQPLHDCRTRSGRRAPYHKGR